MSVISPNWDLTYSDPTRGKTHRSTHQELAGRHHLQGVWEGEGTAQAGSERGHLRNPPALNAQHVERHQAILRLVPGPKVGGCRRLPVGSGRHRPKIALPVDGVQLVQPD